MIDPYFNLINDSLVLEIRKSENPIVFLNLNNFLDLDVFWWFFFSIISLAQSNLIVINLNVINFIPVI